MPGPNASGRRAPIEKLARTPLGPATKYFGVFSGEFDNALAACAAWRSQCVAVSDNQNFGDFPFARGDHGRDCGGLRANPDRERRIFDVRAAIDGARGRPDGRPDGEPRIGRISIAARCRRSLKRDPRSQSSLRRFAASAGAQDSLGLRAVRSRRQVCGGRGNKKNAAASPATAFCNPPRCKQSWFSAIRRFSDDALSRIVQSSPISRRLISRR